MLPRVLPTITREQEKKPKLPQEYGHPKGKKATAAIILCVVMLFCVVLGLFVGIEANRLPNEARQTYIDSVKAICQSYGLGNVRVDISSSGGGNVLYYYPHIEVEGLSGLTLRNQYALVKALNDLEIGRVDKISVTMATVHCDGKKYDISPWNAPTLQVDGKGVYPSPTKKPSAFSTWSSKSYTSSSSSKSTTTTTKKAATTNKSTTSSTSKKTTTTRSDPYDVQDYSDPEEFYYYHYDDFYDYEDAEDYFNEHGG